MKSSSYRMSKSTSLAISLTLACSRSRSRVRVLFWVGELHGDSWTNVPMQFRKIPLHDEKTW